MDEIGVALGSGGAATLAQIGVLEELQDAGIEIAQVAGTSGGAIVGAAFSAGGLRALRDEMAALSRRRVLGLFDPTWPRLGMLEGRRAMEFVRPHVGERIEALPLPYAAIATDLDTAESVSLREGDVVQAIRASIAIPGIFTPSVLDRRLLVDGALSDPIPVRETRALGARFVLAVNVLPLAGDVLERAQADVWSPRHLLSQALDSLAPILASLGREEPPGNVPVEDEAQSSDGGDAGDAGLDPDERRGVVDVILRASHLGQCQIAALRLRAEPPDYLLTVPVPPIGLFDFHRAAELAELGREAARRELPALLDALRRAEPVTRRIARWAAGTLPDAPEADAETSGEAVDAEPPASTSPVAAEAADEEADPRA